MLSEKSKQALAKFSSRAQMLQFLAKKYSKKFNKGPDFYKEWKKSKEIESATELPIKDLEMYISQFETALDTGIA